MDLQAYYEHHWKRQLLSQFIITVERVCIWHKRKKKLNEHLEYGTLLGMMDKRESTAVNKYLKFRMFINLLHNLKT